MPKHQRRKSKSASGNTKSDISDDSSKHELFLENYSHLSESQWDGGSIRFQLLPYDSGMEADQIYEEPVERPHHHEANLHLNVDRDIHDNSNSLRRSTFLSSYEDNLSLVYESPAGSNMISKEKNAFGEKLSSAVPTPIEPDSKPRVTLETKKKYIRKKNRKDKQLNLENMRKEFPNNLRCTTVDGRGFLLWQIFETAERIVKPQTCFIEVIPGNFHVKIEILKKHIIGATRILPFQTLPFQKLNRNQFRFAEWLKEQKEMFLTKNERVPTEIIKRFSPLS